MILTKKIHKPKISWMSKKKNCKFRTNWSNSLNFPLIHNKITHMWRRPGTPQNFVLAFIDELEKQIFITKLLKRAKKKQNNFNIYNVALKKQQQQLEMISLSKSRWYDLQFLRYKAKQTEIGNFGPFFVFHPENQNFEKMKKLLEIISFYKSAP